MSNDINNCYICFDNKISNNFKCSSCDNSVCAKCFYKISKDFFDSNEEKMNMNYKCPVCRCQNIYSYIDFDKDESIFLATSHIIHYNKKIKEQKFVENQINDLQIQKDNYEKTIKYLKEELEKSNEYKKKIDTIFVKCNENKNKTIKKSLLYSLYNNI